MEISATTINLLLTIFVGLSASVFFLYRILEKRFSYTVAEQVRIVQVLLFLAFFLIHGSLTLGLKNILLYILVSTVLSGLLEAIGTNTGWLTGKFKYTNRACPLPSILGVPLCYPLAWCGLIYIGMWTAICFTTNFKTGNFEIGLPVFLLTPVLVTLLDVILDPIAVHEGRWFWEKPGRFYGVPFSNFRGWFVTTLIIILSFTYALRPELQMNDLSRWFVFAPALGFALLAAAAGRVCFERQLKIPGIIAIITAIVSLTISLIKIV